MSEEEDGFQELEELREQSEAEQYEILRENND